MGDGKAKNAMEYLDYLIEKGKVSAGAIKPLKVAFSRIVNVVDGDDWEQTDVRSIDIEDYMTRFANLTMGKYTIETLTAYKSRASRAIVWYVQFLDKPGWSPDVQARNKAAKIEAKKPILTTTPGKNITVTTQYNSGSVSSAKNVTHQTPTDVTSQINYPYPLSDGQLINISLPLKLSKKDARRIGTFIESIAIEETLAIGPGNE